MRCQFKGFFFALLACLMFDFFYACLKRARRICSESGAFTKADTSVLANIFHWMGIFSSSLIAVFATAHFGNCLVFVGSGMLAIGLLVRWLAVQLLGPYFTSDIAICKNHQLVEAGLYKLIRHPYYAGAFLAYSGAGLISRNAMVIALLNISQLIGLYLRIRSEERLLNEYFGEKYGKYCQRTRRIIPYLF
ncbi:isoprenylcysteine carboxylmethyltransferase family protein [candidate division KSB1 bacterium]|nr:isoprenylcysteine carboxylmethyltransferase family protein [candidate division KSB1 bacterium]